jgi:hypothetical protein
MNMELVDLFVTSVLLLMGVFVAALALSAFRETRQRKARDRENRPPPD